MRLSYRYVALFFHIISCLHIIYILHNLNIKVAICSGSLNNHSIIVDDVNMLIRSVLAFLNVELSSLPIEFVIRRRSWAIADVEFPSDSKRGMSSFINPQI